MLALCWATIWTRFSLFYKIELTFLFFNSPHLSHRFPSRECGFQEGRYHFPCLLPVRSAWGSYSCSWYLCLLDKLCSKIPVLCRGNSAQWQCQGCVAHAPSLPGIRAGRPPGSLSPSPDLTQESSPLQGLCPLLSPARRVDLSFKDLLWSGSSGSSAWLPYALERMEHKS